MKQEPHWLRRDVVLAIHREHLLAHGGAAGVRDEDLLDSALARPWSQWAHEEAPPTRMAVAYASSFVRDHPFMAGNRRTALLALYTFLAGNGLRLEATEAEAAAAILALESGEVSELEFERWLHDHVKGES